MLYEVFSTTAEFKAAGVWILKSRKSSQRGTVPTKCAGELRAYSDLGKREKNINTVCSSKHRNAKHRNLML